MIKTLSRAALFAVLLFTFLLMGCTRTKEPPHYSVSQGPLRDSSSFRDPELESEAESTQEETTEPPEEAIFEEPLTREDFFAEPLPDDVINRMMGVSYPYGIEPPVSLSDLSYLHLYHIDFNGDTALGEMVCHKDVAEDLLDIFYELYAIRYPIQSIRLIDDYEGNDELSMQANNTSCFCYRMVDGETYLSSHSYGRSVDLNPLYNPMVSLFEGKTYYSPRAGREYGDRSRDFDHKITKEDPAFQIFNDHGFYWGGSWTGPRQDYMHFAKIDQ